jgi:hypothetical protein
MPLFLPVNQTGKAMPANNFRADCRDTQHFVKYKLHTETQVTDTNGLSTLHHVSLR